MDEYVTKVAIHGMQHEFYYTYIQQLFGVTIQCCCSSVLQFGFTVQRCKQHKIKRSVVNNLTVS